MNIKEAQAITHTLSKPGKMPGWAYSTPAHECKTGTKLRAVAGSVCANCYAYERGRYRFQNVKDAQYKRFEALKHPLWATAMALQINSKKVKYFRWHDSGDIQNLDHLNKIYEVCRLLLIFSLSAYPSITFTSFAAIITLIELLLVSFAPTSVAFVSIKFALNFFL